MNALFMVMVIDVLIVSVIGVWFRSAHRSVGRAAGEVGLHRARRSLDTAFLKQDIRRDGRRLRRELSRELEDLGNS
jgi:hypothetical protein